MGCTNMLINTITSFHLHVWHDQNTWFEIRNVQYTAIIFASHLTECERKL